MCYIHFITQNFVFSPVKRSVRHSAVDVISSGNSLPNSFGNARFVCSAHDITSVCGAIKVAFSYVGVRIYG